MRWEIIDAFQVLKKNSYARARKAYSGKEDFFKEHFPGNPRVPESFFVEMIAQTGGVLFGLGLDFKKEIILAKITKASFDSAVAPPCEFKVEAQIQEEREEGALVSGTVTLGRDLVASAEILLVAVESLDPLLQRKIVFNDNFMKLYDIPRVVEMSQALSR